MISFNRELQDHYSIKLSIKAVGATPRELVERIINVFKSINQFVNFSSFYQQTLKEETSKAFPNKDWGNYGVAVKVREEDFVSDWAETMIFQKPWLLFGVVDLSRVNQEKLPEDIQKFKRRALDEKWSLVRVLLMNIKGNESILSNNDKSFIIVPPLNDEKLSVYLEDQLQIFLCEFIIYLAQELEKLKQKLFTKYSLK